MATSPLFGWEEPDDTDLVKDGAAAIRTLGNAIDTSMGDLLGGSTGQVLSKASNANMDFTWVTSDDANAIQNTIVDAKGDLISATGSDVPARLAVGNNGETLVADSSTSTGLRYQGSMAAGKNFAINGGFDIWQRGTSSATQGAYTTADRWWMNAGNGTCTFSQETTTIPTGSRYALKALTGTTASVQFRQAIETMNAIQLAGKTVVLSGEYQASTTTTIQTKLFYSTSVDNSVSGSWTEITATTGGTATAVNGSFTKSSSVFAVPSTAKSLLILFDTAVLGSAVSLYYGNISLELGSVATAFSRAGGTIQGELSACQRYYFRMNSNAVSSFAPFAQGGAGSTTSSEQFITYPVTMRTNPSSTVDFANLSLIDAAGGSAAVTALTLGQNTLQSGLLTATVASGLTQHRYYRLLANNSSSAFVGLTAEL